MGILSGYIHYWKLHIKLWINLDNCVFGSLQQLYSSSKYYTRQRVQMMVQVHGGVSSPSADR